MHHVFSSNDNKKSFKNSLRKDSALYVAELNVKIYLSNKSFIYSEPPY